MPLPDPSPIYLDYHATTPVDPRVAEVVQRFMTIEFGNASSTDPAWGDRPCFPKVIPLYWLISPQHNEPSTPIHLRSGETLASSAIPLP